MQYSVTPQYVFQEKAFIENYKRFESCFQKLYPNITVNLRLYNDYGKIYNDAIKEEVPTDAEQAAQQDEFMMWMNNPAVMKAYKAYTSASSVGERRKVSQKEKKKKKEAEKAANAGKKNRSKWTTTTKAETEETTADTQANNSMSLHFNLQTYYFVKNKLS